MQDEIPALWGILELMGHKALAGRISGVGTPLVRIDVPATDAHEAFTQFYGAQAIYAITPTSEDVARTAAQDYAINPISVYAPSLIKKEDYDRRLDQMRNANDELRTALRESHRKLLEAETSAQTAGQEEE